MKREHVRNCMFSTWYPHFRQLTIKSRIIKLPDDFVNYLLADGIVLPADNGPSPSCREFNCEDSDNKLHSKTVESQEADDWSDCDDEVALPNFPELQAEVNEAIKELSGAVFPKLNWSCPKDARWISADGTLKCRSFSDICLLLKSSDFIMHDLTNAFEFCEDSTERLPTDSFELVLRKWTEISPAAEFRCFVKKDRLIAITQRDTTNFYDFLLANSHKVHRDITEFFKMKIQSKFVESSFVFDIWRYGDGKLTLIDVNPFSAVTDSLLFTWQELRDGLNDVCHENNETQGELRLVPEGATSLQPSQYLSYQLPKDVIDFASGGQDINKLVDYLDFNKLT
eukprot:gene6883-7658_t